MKQTLLTLLILTCTQAAQSQILINHKSILFNTKFQKSESLKSGLGKISDKLFKSNKKSKKQGSWISCNDLKFADREQVISEALMMPDTSSIVNNEFSSSKRKCLIFHLSENLMKYEGSDSNIDLLKLPPSVLDSEPMAEWVSEYFKEFDQQNKSIKDFLNEDKTFHTKIKKTQKYKVEFTSYYEDKLNLVTTELTALAIFKCGKKANPHFLILSESVGGGGTANPESNFYVAEKETGGKLNLVGSSKDSEVKLSAICRNK